MTEPIRVLFVDNEVVTREWLAQKLRHNNQYQVDCVDNGHEALAKVKEAQDNYDVVLLDQRLEPEMDGVTVMKLIRQDYPSTEAIIFTGYGDIEEGLRAMEAGACYYVFKPLSDRGLALYIKSAAERSRLRISELERNWLQHVQQVLQTGSQGANAQIEDVAVFIKSAAERARLRAVEVERDWLQNVLSISQATTKSLNPIEVAREVCEPLASQIPDLKLFYVAHYNENRNEARFLWAIGEEGKVIKMEPRLLSEENNWGLAGYVIKTGEMISESDLEKNEELRRMRLNKLPGPTRACLSIPLVSRGKIIGVLSAQSRKPDVFTQKHWSLLNALANHTAVSIDNAQQHQETIQRLATLKQLYDTLASLPEAFNIDGVSHLIVDKLHEEFQLDTCTVGLFDKDLKKVSFIAKRGLNGQKVERNIADLPQDLRDRAFASSDLIEVLDLDEHANLRRALERPELKSFVIIPLHGKTQPLGIITMGSLHKLALNTEQKDLLRALAGQAALRLENAQKFEETTNWAQQLDRLDQVERDIAIEREITPLLRTIAGKAREFLDAAGSSVFLLSKDNQQFELVAATGRNSDLERKVFSVDRGVIGKVFETKKPYIENDYPNWPGKLDDFDSEQRAVMGVPIFSDTEIIGVLTVNDVKEKHAFNNADEELLSRMGKLAGIEIEKARLLEKYEKLLEEREATTDVTQVLVSELHYEQLFKTIFDKLSDRFGYDTCAVLLEDPRAKELYIDRAIGYPPEVIKKRRIKTDGSEGGVTAWVFREGQPRIVPDVKNEPLYIESAKGSLSEIAVPLIHRGETFGVLNVESKGLNAFNDRDLRILMQAAASIATAIKNAQLFARELKKTRALRRMIEVDKTINSKPDLDQVLKEIAKHARKLLKAEVCSVFHVQRKGFLRLKASEGAHSFNHELELEIKTGEGTGLTGDIAAKGRLVNFDSAQLQNHPAVKSHEPKKYLPSGVPKSLLAIPLKQGKGQNEEIIGLIKIENKKGRGRRIDPEPVFDDQDELIIETLAGYAEKAINKANQLQMGERLAAAKSAAISLAATFAWAHDAAGDTFILRCDAENLMEYLKDVPGLDPSVRETVKRIGVRAEKLASLIPNTPPDFSQKEPVDVARVLNDISLRRESELSEKKIKFTISLPETSTVLANKQAVFEICDNLIRNAIRAMPNGGRLSCSGKVMGEQLYVEVADTGTGVPSEVQDMLFQRRVHGPRRQGTGIGLLLTRSYLLAYDGDIKLQRSDFNGTTFEFYLPLAMTGEISSEGSLYAKAGNSIS